jgi:hypothetical protein
MLILKNSKARKQFFFIKIAENGVKDRTDGIKLLWWVEQKLSHFTLDPDQIPSYSGIL